ncbi:MAG: ABC transporter ATP-binding protein [Gammaproteobacteria bacterium]
MTDVLLSVRDLRAHLGDEQDPVRAVDGVSFDIQVGETFALLGESGCGKTMTALSLMRLLPGSGRIVGGEVLFQGRDLLRLPEAAMREVRGGGLAMVFQEPMTSLNPVMSVGDQIAEALVRHTKSPGVSVRQRVRELLEAVRIPDAGQRMHEYPHQLSGGMKQRVVIAIALAGDPVLLIADEPTTALDVTIQAQVLDLLRTLQQERNMSVLLITHDLGVVAETADRVAVMYAGQIVEQATRAAFFATPRHPYSRKLFDSLPSMEKRREDLHVIRGYVPSLQAEFTGCRFAPRCEVVLDVCHEHIPQWHESRGHGALCHLWADPAQGSREDAAGTQTPATGVRREAAGSPSAGGALLEVRALAIHFPIHKGLFKRTAGYVRAVDGVELSIPRGRTLALVGESGCGKTTVGKGILQLLRVTGGQVLFEGQELTTLKRAQMRRRRSEMQIIFQDPVSSMNPRMLVGDIIAEGLVASAIGGGRHEHGRRVATLLEQVGMPVESAHRYPHEFSGGQRQRVCIARALAVKPKLIVCDEPTSALDVSVQAQILNLLKRLQDELQLSYLFITHDVSVVSYIADEVAVMYLGRIVEHGDVETILRRPSHPYTEALMSAVPRIEDDGGNRSGRKVLRVEGDLPSPAKPPAGCHFHPRCPRALPVCLERYPARRDLGNGHSTRCHLYE